MEIKGDFLGFTFNGTHSSELGIVRVSDGDRYKESLHPEIKDVSTEVPNKNGEYYFGSTYGTRHFNLNIAYDSITESQMRRLRQVFGTQKICSLIFDEVPYKRYLVKLEDPIELSYVCFGEALYETEVAKGQGIKGTDLSWQGERKKNSLGAPAVERIYKGEGTIDLIAYYPFAKSCFKVLPTTEYDNVDEWAAASKLVTSDIYKGYEGKGFDTVFETEGSYKSYIYNAGDVETGCRIYCPFVEESSSFAYDELEITYSPYENAETKTLRLEKVERSATNANDQGFLINTDTGLIQGVKNINYDIAGNPIITTSTSLYNVYVKSGEFFKLQPNLNHLEKSSIIFKGGNESIRVFYDYLYF